MSAEPTMSGEQLKMDYHPRSSGLPFESRLDGRGTQAVTTELGVSPEAGTTGPEFFASGESLKMTGMTLADTAASVDWKRRWDIAIRYLALRGEPFTTDEIRRIAGPPEDHPNAAGARLNSAARAGLIRSIGYQKSTRDTLRAHPLTLWVGA